MLKLPKSGVNMISEKLYADIPKFKENETKVFQTLNGIPNGDPDLTERAKEPILYGHCQIPTQDRIKDPYTGEHINIGVVEDFVPETSAVLKYKLFVPGMHEGKFWGKFTLKQGNQDDEELYEYLCICNYNRDNPNRNKKTEPLFYEIKTPAEKIFTPLPKVVTAKRQEPVEAV